MKTTDLKKRRQASDCLSSHGELQIYYCKSKNIGTYWRHGHI